jgi:hypothetical protein
MLFYPFKNYQVVKVVDFKLLAPHHCGFETWQGLWILSCEEAIQLAYGTWVVLLRCLFMQSTWRLSAPVKMEHCHMTYTVSVWCKNLIKQTIKNYHYFEKSFIIKIVIMKFFFIVIIIIISIIIIIMIIINYCCIEYSIVNVFFKICI